jgi:C-terminal processing protease CtpA/Prc
VSPSDPSYLPPEKASVVDLGGGVACRVPGTLPFDGQGTLPRAEAEPRHSLPANLAPHARHRASRLAAVLAAWNAPQHFYPYFGVVDADWPAELARALSAAAVDDGELPLLRTLRRMFAALDDGHARVQHESETRGLLLPMQLTWVGGELAVVAAREELELAAGDVVQAIDGVPVAELARSLGEEISSPTEQWRRVRLLTELSRCPSTAPRTLTVLRGGADAEPFTVQVRPKAPTHELPPPPRPAALTELEPGTWYVDATRFDAAAYREALPSLAAARGLIFDFRGYPGDVDRDLLFSHLSVDTLESPEWHVPVVRHPDLAGLEFLQEESWVIPPEAPYLAGRKAFLIDGRAISFAESCLGIVEAFRLGDLVGEPTAGTNGNVCSLEVPGGYQVFFTGLRVLKHGGSRHHGVGIQPTVPATATLAGIAAGRDEVLERALELVRE